MRTVEPEQLGDAVNQILEQYSDEVLKVSKEAVKECANSCKENIMRGVDSAGISGTGDYRRSWKAEVESETDMAVSYVVHSEAPYYRLAHLLEYGHEIWVHGNAIGKKTRAFAHIRPAAKQVKKEFENKIKVGITK